MGFEPETLEVEIIMVTTVNDTDCTLDTNYVNEQQRKKTREVENNKSSFEDENSLCLIHQKSSKRG